MFFKQLYDIKSKKYKKLSFSRRNLFITEYFIDSYKLENVVAFQDLDVLFSYKLCFNLPFEHTVNKKLDRYRARDFDDP